MNTLKGYCFQAFLIALMAFGGLAQASPVVVIVKAVYGVAGHDADVTPVLVRSVSAGKYVIDVDNDTLQVDPALYTVKHLSVQYTLDGVAKTANVNEGDSLNLLTGAIKSAAGGQAMITNAVASPEALAAVKARIVPVVHPCDDYVVASAIATEAPFGAKADGATDCTAAVQAAIDAVSNAGGGVVFLPHGRYRFEGNIILRPAVTLRGDWKAPGQTPDSFRVAGTVLMPVGGRGQADGTPFITIQAGACLRNLSIWYPDQKIGSITPYPWTVTTDIHAGMDNYTVEYVTLVNPYQGLRFGPDDNELSVVRYVYGTPLKIGYAMYTCTDSPRMTVLKFSARYWLESGLGDRPDSAALSSYLHQNATGMNFMRTDGHDLFDVAVTGYHVGIHVYKGPQGTPYGGMYGVSATGGDIGLLVDEVRTGWQLTNCRFQGETAGILAKEPFITQLQLEHCRLAGRSAFRSEGSGAVQMHSCVFSGNVEMVSKGSISMLDCTLVNKTDHVVLARDVSRALILGGIASSAVESHSLGDVQVDPVPVAALPAPPMPVLPPDPRPAKPLLFNVMDYGAVADGQSVTPADNTKAFQKALAAAGKAGGGTVYVPGGFYVLAGSLTVPTGVELRGCFDAPHHTQSKGTVLFPTGGRGQDHGTPLISLSPGSGVRGLTVYYPDQKMDQITPYPWTFRSLGPRCWIMDIATANAYRLADFGTYPSEGHLIRYVMGFPLKSGLWVSKGSGVVDGCHFNPHFWGRRYKGAPNPTSSPSVTEKDAGKFIDEQIFNHEENYVFGSCPNELIVNLATCPGGLALAFIADGAGATGALVMNQESDSTTSPLHVEAASKSGITLYNTVLAPVDLTQDAQAISIAPSCKGNVLLCNGMTWIENKKPAFALLGSGRTVMHNWLLGQDDIVAGNGSVVLQGMMCRTSAHDDVQVVSPMKQLLLNGDSSGSDVFTYPLHSASVEARGNAKLAPSIPLKDSFVTGFEKGQPQPTPHVVAVYEMKSTDCQVVPGAGRDGGAGLVLTASPIIEGKHAAVVYELFLPRGVVIGKDTLFRFWLKPDTDVARTTVLGLTYTDGSNGVPPDTTGRIMHPMTPRGAAGKWTRIECWLGSFAAGKTLRSIQTIFDFANPSADCRCTFDDIEIGEPIKPIGQ